MQKQKPQGTGNNKDSAEEKKHFQMSFSQIAA